MLNRHRIAALFAILALCLASQPTWSAAPGGGGGFHGGGGGGHSGGSGGASFHPSGGGAPAFHPSGGGAAPMHIGGSGGAPQFHTNNFTTNRTPTFTHPTTNLGASHITSGTATFHSGNAALHTGTGTFHTGSGAISAGKIGSVGAGSTLHTGTFHTNTGNFGAARFGTAGSGAAFHNPAFHNPGLVHPINAHVGTFHQAYIGNHAIRVAPLGYHPSYFYHPWYHGPWTGHAYGWGWGWGPGFGIGLGLGLGLGGGWGYGGYGGYGGYYPYGPYGYWGRPLGWGFGGWGLGGWMYSSGYNPYYNPYYVPVVNQPIVYNYANPIPVTSPVPTVAATTVDDTAQDGAEAPAPVADNPDFDAARDAFRQGDYQGALANVDTAIRKVPGDAVLHEFRALTLFALQDYKQAAAVVHSVLAMGPGWDWTTMSSLYGDPDAYTQQLRALEEYTLANPKAADAHFLLAYHYMICSHNDAAAGQLMQVTRLMPSDRLAGELLRMVQGPPKQDQSEPPGPGPGTPAPADSAGGTPQQPPDIDTALLPGTWRASRPDGSKFELNLTDDGNFTWKFAPPRQKPQEFGGTYKVEGPVLVLERKEGGGALAGTVTFDGDGKFNFRAVGGPPDDTGLDFGK